MAQEMFIGYRDMIHSRSLKPSETTETGFAIQDESGQLSHDDQRTRQVMVDISTTWLPGKPVKTPRSSLPNHER
jgi:hypothetical protein